MDEKERQRLLKFYEECDSDEISSERDPYSTDEDSDYEANSSELNEGSSDSEFENTNDQRDARKYPIQYYLFCFV